MSIVELQRKARRLGEIRLGDKTDSGRPYALDTFRLTSVAKGLLDRAASLWGGTVEPWDRKWTVTLETAELPVIVPPQDPDDVTWYESWTAGGLQRRCDGEHIVNRGDPLPCVCDPQNRECRMVTRLQVMLPDLPDVGVWLMSSTGYYAASELAMSIEVVMGAAQKTGLLPAATLAIEPREVKRPNEPLKQFVVPVLRFEDALSTFIDSPTLAAPSTPALGDGDGGEPVPPSPVDPTVAEIVEGDHAVDVWSDLLRLVDVGYDPAATKPEIQADVYRLFKLMWEADMWGEHAREAALQKAYGHDHLTDLRKDDLVDFAGRSFDAAKAAIAEQELR